MSVKKIAGAEQGVDPAIFDECELLVLRFSEQVVRKVKADRDLFDAVVAKLGNRHLSSVSSGISAGAK